MGYELSGGDDSIAFEIEMVYSIQKYRLINLGKLSNGNTMSRMRL